MANLKEIRNRITSIGNTMQITSAMKMVSASKLKRAQDAIVQMRPFAQKLQEILSNLSSSLDSSDGVYSQEREVKNVVIVTITGNRGLCGGFNNNVIKKANLLAKDYPEANIIMLPVGKKSLDAYRRTELMADHSYPQDLNLLWDDLTFGNVARVPGALMEKFVSKEIDKVVVIYNAFKNAATQVITTEQLLPVVAPEVAKDAKSVAGSATSSIDYLFEPNQQEIVAELIPKSLKTQFYKAMLDSFASEHGARMTAMHKATDNANEMRDDLKLTYNKARQTAITAEILEIVGGAEALKS
jgi:F-type H+-transporting ATPase subunit gamma